MASLLTLCLTINADTFLTFADRFGSRSHPTESQVWNGFKLFDTLMVSSKCVFQKIILKKSVDDNHHKKYSKHAKSNWDLLWKQFDPHSEWGKLFNKYGFWEWRTQSVFAIYSFFLRQFNLSLYYVCFIGINPNRKCVCQVSLVIFLRIVTCNVRWISLATKTQKCPNIIS